MQVPDHPSAPEPAHPALPHLRQQQLRRAAALLLRPAGRLRDQREAGACEEARFALARRQEVDCRPRPPLHRSSYTVGGGVPSGKTKRLGCRSVVTATSPCDPSQSRQDTSRPMFPRR